MAESVLDGKRMLAVDDEPDVLDTLEDEIKEASPSCEFDKARSYEEAADLLRSHHYDLVILDIMGVRGFELLELAVGRNYRVVMLTAHSFSPESLKKAHDLGARAYLPKEKMGEIVSFLEDALTLEFETGWKRAMRKLEALFDALFEWNWRSKASVERYYEQKKGLP
jgi:DNA-binding NarL/FixJ family response regulator